MYTGKAKIVKGYLALAHPQFNVWARAGGGDPPQAEAVSEPRTSMASILCEARVEGRRGP
ncbi:MAG TPA: hypothetical protein VJM77_04315 [Nitrospiria bacterium]|nr:hypothetical protein [Nitrospiria bacterium]